MKVVRRARSEDYTALCGLLDEVDRLHRERLPAIFRVPTGPARSPAYIEELLRDPQALVLLAELDGRAAGCVVALLRSRPPLPFFVPASIVIVDSLAVDPAHRRLGIGRALLAEVDAWARQNGASSVELNVYEFNEDAIAFYRALGYETLMRRMERRIILRSAPATSP
ncbi:MAG TPA: GNAT family N-acetyltransferase [Anaerolineae bacterium]|nr:GNAT family N-acetyltransferase [Anaerolineae bacterium]HPL29792.1 GNAT family N-acetyltransferase [Anaerolineae bacterium]